MARQKKPVVIKVSVDPVDEMRKMAWREKVQNMREGRVLNKARTFRSAKDYRRKPKHKDQF